MFCINFGFYKCCPQILLIQNTEFLESHCVLCPRLHLPHPGPRTEGTFQSVMVGGQKFERTTVTESIYSAFLYLENIKENKLNNSIMKFQTISKI